MSNRVIRTPLTAARGRSVVSDLFGSQTHQAVRPEMAGRAKRARIVTANAPVGEVALVDN